MYLEEWLSMARTVVVIDSDVLVKRSKLKFTVLGKEIIQCLGQQVLNCRVMLSREKAQLLFDRGWKVSSDVAFPFPSSPDLARLRILGRLARISHQR